MKTAIITYTDVNNPGALLQAYALQETIKNITKDEVYQISHRKTDDHILSKIKSPKDLAYNVYYLKDYPARKRRNERYEHFRSHYLNLTKACYTNEEKQRLNEQFDTFVTGSDQVWNCQHGMYSPFFLDFVHEEKNKIAYAASMGKVDISEKLLGQFVESVKRFNSVSVRENQVADYLREKLNITSSVTCDPVFLLPCETWNKIAEKGAINPPKKFIFVFTTEMTKEFLAVIKKIQKDTGLPVVSLRSMPGVWGKVCLDAGPLEFIRYIRDSELVVANSFHAIAFSTIFQKNFYCVLHSSRGSRLTSLLDILGLSNRIVTSDTCIPYQQINYCDANKKLSDYKAYSLNYLKEALQTSNSEKSYSELAIEKIVHNGDCYSCGACANICPRHAITMLLGKDGFTHPYVNHDICVDCNMCQRVCPADGDVDKLANRKIWYAKHLDNTIRVQSSSGGMFTALSDYILHNGGVVYGCVLDRMDVVMVRADDAETRNRMRGSKYVHSDMDKCYQQIAQDAANGTFVMFTGTPCQCHAVKKYLAAKNINTKNIFIMDFICHGTTSPMLYREYILWLEKQFHSTVNKYNFRPNLLNGVNQKAYALFDNGYTYLAPSSVDPYYTVFLGDQMHKASCYHCAFTSVDRVADITVGDLRDKTIGSGYSLIMVNSEKGEDWLEAVKKSLVLEEYDFSRKLQPQLKHPVKEPQDRFHFLSKYQAGKTFPEGYALPTLKQTKLIICIEKLINRLHLFHLIVKLHNILKK